MASNLAQKCRLLQYLTPSIYLVSPTFTIMGGNLSQLLGHNVVNYVLQGLVGHQARVVIVHGRLSTSLCESWILRYSCVCKQMCVSISCTHVPHCVRVALSARSGRDSWDWPAAQMLARDTADHVDTVEIIEKKNDHHNVNTNGLSRTCSSNTHHDTTEHAHSFTRHTIDKAIQLL